MKKLSALLACLALLFSIACADTISLDTETATLSELLSLRDKLNELILEKQSISATELQQGVYIVGTDIAAGEYTLSCGESSESAFIFVYAPDAADWYAYERFYAIGTFHDSMTVGKLVLEDGFEIDIQGASVTFTPKAKGEARIIERRRYSPNN